MSEVLGSILALGIVLGISFGSLAVMARTNKGVILGSILAILFLSLLSVLGSALVGPVDLSPMLIFTPVVILSGFLWKWRISKKALNDS